MLERASLTALLAAAAVGLGCAHAEPAAELPAVDPSSGTLHLRVQTSRGPVHLFRPPGYDARTAGLVLYVHGHFTDVDHACSRHRLTEQFLASGLNALFVSPEAPEGSRQAVVWPDLPELLTVLDTEGLEVPRGPVVAVAHSGGFRTVAAWLSSGLVDSVVLLDALYGLEDEFRAWLDTPDDERRLVLVGANTTERIERFLADFGDVVVRDTIPLRPEQGLAEARLVFLRSQFGHMELVTEGRALPAVLRLVPMPRLDDRS